MVVFDFFWFVLFVIWFIMLVIYKLNLLVSLFFFKIVFLIILVFVWIGWWEIEFWLLFVFFFINLDIFILEVFFKFLVINCFCWMGIWIFEIVFIFLLFVCFFLVFRIILVVGEMSGCFVEVIRVYRVFDGKWIFIDESFVVFFKLKLFEWKVLIVVYRIFGLVLFEMFL